MKIKFLKCFVCLPLFQFTSMLSCKTITKDYNFECELGEDTPIRYSNNLLPISTLPTYTLRVLGDISNNDMISISIANQTVGQQQDIYLYVPPNQQFCYISTNNPFLRIPVRLYDDWKNDLITVQFNFEFTIFRDSIPISKFSSSSMYFVNGTPTTDDMFVYDDNDHTKLISFSDEPWARESIKNCNILLIPKTVTEITDGAFARFVDNEWVTTLPSSITNILFEHQFNSGVFIPKIEKIGQHAFANCNSLNSTIYFPTSIISIGSNAFVGNTNLSSIQFINNNQKEQIITIGDSAFSRCTSIEKVILTKNIKTVENGGFSNCENLKQVYIESPLTQLNNSIFDYCTSLRLIDLSEITDILPEASWIGTHIFSHLPTDGVVYIGQTIPKEEWTNFLKSFSPLNLWEVIPKIM